MLSHPDDPSVSDSAGPADDRRARAEHIGDRTLRIRLAFLAQQTEAEVHDMTERRARENSTRRGRVTVRPRRKRPLGWLLAKRG